MILPWMILLAFRTQSLKFADANEFQVRRRFVGLWFTPKALQNKAQGRGASPRTLGWMTNNGLP